MIEIVTYGLLAIGGVVLLAAGGLAAWRLIPRPEPPPDVASLSVDVAALRLQIADLEERFVSFVQRDRGRKRKKDREDEEAQAEATVVPLQPALEGKAALRAQAANLGLIKS